MNKIPRKKTLTHTNYTHRKTQFTSRKRDTLHSHIDKHLCNKRQFHEFPSWKIIWSIGHIFWIGYYCEFRVMSWNCWIRGESMDCWNIKWTIRWIASFGFWISCKALIRFVSFSQLHSKSFRFFFSLHYGSGSIVFAGKSFFSIFQLIALFKVLSNFSESVNKVRFWANSPRNTSHHTKCQWNFR